MKLTPIEEIRELDNTDIIDSICELYDELMSQVADEASAEYMSVRQRNAKKLIELYSIELNNFRQVALERMSI